MKLVWQIVQSVKAKRKDQWTSRKHCDTSSPDVHNCIYTHKKILDVNAPVQALLHTLPLEYITIPQLQAALNGVSKRTASRFMAQMSRDGFIENTPKSRRLGKCIYFIKKNRAIIRLF